MAYENVNAAWPAGTNEGRDLKPTAQEALSAARRLYRFAFKRPFRGTMKLTSGGRYTYIRRHVFYVNPDQGGGGWHELVHSISHMVAGRLHNEAHGYRHAFIEREMIAYVVRSGWLDGKLKREEKPKADVRVVRHQRALASLKRWQAKAKRAETAMRKLRKQVRYYETVSSSQSAGQAG